MWRPNPILTFRIFFELTDSSQQIQRVREKREKRLMREKVSLSNFRSTLTLKLRRFFIEKVFTSYIEKVFHVKICVSS